MQTGLWRAVGLILCLVHTGWSAVTPNACDQYDVFVPPLTCHYLDSTTAAGFRPIYILFDINPSEGFNLRRDVFQRMLIFVKHLRAVAGYEAARLVLPPQSELLHWTSWDIDQNQILWSHFFDLPSLRRFTAVSEMYEFFDDWRSLYGTRNIAIDSVFQLKNYPPEQVFVNGHFINKFDEIECESRRPRFYFRYKNVTDVRYKCVQFQGHASSLRTMFDRFKPQSNGKPWTVLILNAEIALHDEWANPMYWSARRSMRFANDLETAARLFRERVFNTTDQSEAVQRPIDWRDEEDYRRAIGAGYICGHVRRKDFMRKAVTVTLHTIADQLKAELKRTGLRTVFLSSDCSKSEFKDFKKLMSRYRVVRYAPDTISDRQRLKDGGIAIIDQIICSRARVFIGTFESTFTYRIYEEREIMGFAQSTTFNTFCNPDNCERNPVWTIQYETAN